MLNCQRERLEADFTALNQIGRLKNGGYTRVAFSPEDMQARRWLLERMKEAGLEVTIDPVGNMIGRRQGREALAPVMIGSHLDTVPEGGNFDGVVGVLAGLELVRALNDAQVETCRPIEVVNFSAEESSRFGVATLGSKGLLGLLSEDKMRTLTDADGKTLYQVLLGCGFEPALLAEPDRRPKPIHAFLELHIEQGPVLESSGDNIGIVTAIAASTRFKVKITGQAGHSGNTPMDMRRDALTAAAELVMGVESIAKKATSTVGTVGYLQAYPGAMNVIPGSVELGIDIRDICREDKDSAVAAITDLMTTISSKRSVKISYERICHDNPVSLSKRMVNLLKSVASTCDLAASIMTSGAGHDAMNMAQVADTGLIFIPSVDGLSHNIAEYSRIEDICLGTDLLLNTVFQLSNEP